MNLWNTGLTSFMQVFFGHHPIILLSGGVHTPFPSKQSLEEKHPFMVWGWFMIGFTRLLRRTPHHLPSWSYNSNHLFVSSPTSLLAFRCVPFFHPKKHREAEISQASRGWQGWRPTWSSNSKLPVHLPAWEDLKDDRSRLTDNWNRPWDTHKKIPRWPSDLAYDYPDSVHFFLHLGWFRQ